MDGLKKKVLLFILAYNEERNLRDLICEIGEKVDLGEIEWDLVVIDDGSSDSSGQVASTCGVKVIRHPINLGIGPSEQTGIIFAARNGYDIAVRIDGDGQHPPESVADLVGQVASGRAQMAVGSRFAGGMTEGFQSSLLRRIGIRYFSLLLFLLTGRRIKDPTSGFRCFGRESMNLLARLPPPDFPEVETLLGALRSGLEIREVPVAFRPRRSGLSSIRFYHSAYFMVKVTMALVVTALRKHGE